LYSALILLGSQIHSEYKEKQSKARLLSTSQTLSTPHLK
jgi:hypothetical protein